MAVYGKYSVYTSTALIQYLNYTFSQLFDTFKSLIRPLNMGLSERFSKGKRSSLSRVYYKTYSKREINKPEKHTLGIILKELPEILL